MTTPHANPEDLDLYALGALDGEEKQALDAHLRDCPQCQQQLAAARQRTALIGLAAPPMAPRPQVKSALMDKVRAEKRAPITQTAPSKTGKKRWGLRFSFGSRSRQAAPAASGTAFAGCCGPPGHGPDNRRARFGADYPFAATQRTSGTGPCALQRAYGFGCLLRPNCSRTVWQKLPTLARSLVGRARRCRSGRRQSGEWGSSCAPDAWARTQSVCGHFGAAGRQAPAHGSEGSGRRG